MTDAMTARLPMPVEINLGWVAARPTITATRAR